MVGIVSVFEAQVIHLDERLAEAKSPGENRLDVHAVHRDVAATERNLRGVAAQGEVG